MTQTLLKWFLSLVIPAFALGIFVFYGWQYKRNHFKGKNREKLASFEVQGINSAADISSKRPQAKKGVLEGLLRWLLILAFFIFAVIGQINFLNFPAGERTGFYYYALAVFCFILLIWLMRSRDRNIIQPVLLKTPILRRFHFSDLRILFREQPAKAILFGLSLFLAVLALVLLINRPVDNTHWDIFFLWMGSWLCYAAVFIGFSKFNIRNWVNTHKIDILIILLFSIAGALFRFYALGNIPNIIDGDEGRFGLLIIDILEGRIKNMFTTIYGNSNMYFFFLAGLMKIFGISIKILRIGSAIGGTLTIPFLYLMAKKFFNRRTAIISTSILVVSNFHIHFSRIMSVTSIHDALFATLSLYLFYTGLRKQSASRMALAGVVLGLALYIYMGARLIILLIPIYLLILFALHPQMVRNNFANILIFFGALGIVSLPMSYWAISNPIAFNFRANQLGILQSGWLANEALLTGQTQLHIFWDLFKQAFLTTIFYPSYGFHYSSWPMLDMFSSIFFIAGLTYSFIYTKDARYLLLNGWFWSGILVGGALVTLPSVNSYRILIVFPVMCLFAGIGFDRILRYMGERTKKNIYLVLE